ncbi:MAG: BON domain-containing protein [SAR324 cluster bacterium]|nr:BON domain-containing protein [SAR324 cluster bacterium]
MKLNPIFIFLFSLLLTVFHPVLAQENPELSDLEIMNAVETEYLNHSQVPANDIDVLATEGIVTLRGRVNNILAKEHATNVAEVVKGVRAVVNLLELDPPKNSVADTIEQDIKYALLRDPATESYEISVSAEADGLVVLGGVVDSWQERLLAETVAKGVAGVTAINNKIKINFKNNRTDEEIRTEAEQRLRWDIRVDHSLIDVKVNDGKVELRGLVGSAAEKRLARWDASVGGVKSVDTSELEVDWTLHNEKIRANEYVIYSDKEIREALQDALLYDPRVNLFEITPEVSNGYITLKGVVDNLKAKQSAEQDAHNTVGVNGVTNLIKVRPIKNISDAAISKNIRTTLASDVLVNSYEIIIGVASGTVHLYGTVDSNFEKARVEDIAYRSRGVQHVRNHIDVNFSEASYYDPYLYPQWPYYGYPWHMAPSRVYSMTDVEILRKIKKELWWSPFVDADQIEVFVEDGVATLLGVVNSWSDYNAAGNNALEGGAWRVINKIKVREK